MARCGGPPRGLCPSCATVLYHRSYWLIPHWFGLLMGMALCSPGLWVRCDTVFSLCPQGLPMADLHSSPNQDIIHGGVCVPV